MNSNRTRNFTPGSVDSWDMENMNFLRKVRHGGSGLNGRQELDTASYPSTSDTESVIYEDRTIVGELTSEDEKGRRVAGIYGRRRGSSSHSMEDESDFGLTSTNGSETGTPTKLLDEALYSGGNGFALLNKSIVMKQMKSMAASTLKDPYLEDDTASETTIEPATVVRKNPLLEFGALSRKNSRTRTDDPLFDRRFMKSRKPKPSLVTVGFMEPPLEDCYVLDVMTIRNESVVAERGRKPSNHLVLSSDSQDSESDGMEKMLKLNGTPNRNGSTGLPSSSSSTSSVSSTEEYNSAREGSQLQSPGEDGPIEIQRDFSPEEKRASSCSPVSVVVRGECTASTTTRLQSGYSHGSDKSFATASSNYYYLGQNGNHNSFDTFEEEGFDNRSGTSKETMRMLDTPRSPSPYYVRLRRDLIPPSYSPTYRSQRWNFGMDTQGLLVIDYSPNWDGLESYVRSLSLRH